MARRSSASEPDAPRPFRVLLAGALFAVAALANSLFASSARADLAPDELLVVVNDSSAISVAIGDYYQALRGVPEENVFHLPAGTTTAETIGRATFTAEVFDPIREYLEVTAPHLRDQVLCIVTTKGVPLRVSGSGNAAVDSELTQLFTGRVDQGSIPNTYLGTFRDFRRFRDEEGGADSISYLVTRLTGYQTDPDPGTGVPVDILALMDRAVAPPPENGVFLLDQDPTRVGGFAIGNQWMDEAKAALDAMGETTVLDATNTFVRNQPDVVGYASWGSNDCCDAGAPYWGEVPVGSGNVYPGTFLARSITTTYVSTNGRTFTDGSQGYGQSLVADLVREGACAGGGHVYEPFLGAVPQPQRLLTAYARGFTAAEAYYNAIASLGWMNTIVCDPLMRYDDFPAPTSLSVEPASGQLPGGETAAIAGADLREDVRVFFGGVESPSVTWVSPEEVLAVTPPGPGFGFVDVTVRNAFGEDTLDAGFEYEIPPVELALSDTAVGLGEELGLTVTGPPAAPYAVLADLRTGETCVRGVCFDLAFSNKLTALHDAIRDDDDPMGPAGRGDFSIVVPIKPALVGLFVYVQGVVETAPATYETTSLRVFLVLD